MTLPHWARVHANADGAAGIVSCNVADCPICMPRAVINYDTVFSRANDEANESPVALFGLMLYRTPWLPDAIRKWGSRTWNRYYRAALPAHLRGTS